MNTFIETIKNSILYEAIWIIFGIFVGKFIDFLIRVFRTKVKRRKALKELSKESRFSLEYLDILSLDHADPAYELHDIIIEQTNKKLYVDCPTEYKEKIHRLDPTFTFTTSTSFDRNTRFDDLALITQIENLPDLIHEHSVITAKQIMNKIEKGHTIFNGKKYGVYRIHRKRVADHEENASLRLDLFETDYFTHQVFRSIYAELKEQGHEIGKVEKMEEIHRFSPFTTSFGMNTFIILDTPAGEEIIFAKRSKFLNQEMAESQWHVSMNEGLTITDKEGKEVSLIKCLHRGLREELGIREEHHKYINDEKFMDLFLETSKFEIGLTSYVKLNMPFKKLLELYNVSKDGELETDGIVPVEVKNKPLKDFINTHKLTPAAQYTLKMYLARRKY